MVHIFPCYYMAVCVSWYYRVYIAIKIHLMLLGDRGARCELLVCTKCIIILIHLRIYMIYAEYVAQKSIGSIVTQLLCSAKPNAVFCSDCILHLHGSTEVRPSGYLTYSSIRISLLLWSTQSTRQGVWLPPRYPSKHETLEQCRCNVVPVLV